jgi:excisionase family DNA binding protein
MPRSTVPVGSDPAAILTEEPFITSRQAAALLGLKPPALVKAARAGRIPAYVFGNGLKKRRYKFKQSEVLATVRRVEPTSSEKARQS